VEILQEKLDQKLIEDVSRLRAMSGICSATDGSAGSDGTTASAQCDDGLNEFPHNWELMNDNEVYRWQCNFLL